MAMALRYPRLSLRRSSRARSRVVNAAKARRRLRRTHQGNGIALVSFGLATVVAFVFGLVLLNIHIAQSSFRLEEVQKHIARQEADYRRMRYEVARLESPAALSDAVNKLGLVAPESQEYMLGRPSASGEDSIVSGQIAAGQDVKAVLQGR